ncbi:hypothetical protein O181_089855 [Austropuccinia psidii MF-1]|uniref:Nudix hydrolase domain-containing protein n=1 Tax=Austropuccinia psidii MF-1 TaxID=1389203 RepID=A0A9Q3IU29_9BASI|nr:hypothetical protein [Austropuccinia psidii MF-1]
MTQESDDRSFFNLDLSHQKSLSKNLLNALVTLHQTPPAIISTPSIFQSSNLSTSTNTPINSPSSSSNFNLRTINPTKRASVAIIIRILPSNSSPTSSPSSPSTSSLQQSNKTLDVPSQLHQFFNQPWVKDGRPEIFFIKRAARSHDRWSAHLAFPGGKMEPDDEDELFCAMRETWEEVGIDLAERDFILIGRLDDREITTSLGKRLLMVLSPYVFLSTRSDSGPTPSLEPSEVAAAYWIPLHSLTGPQTTWGEVIIDLSTRLAPNRGRLVKFILRSLIGSMRFRSILLPDHPTIDATGSQLSLQTTTDLNLWGLTLGMTLDLLSFFHIDLPIPAADNKPLRSPSLEYLNVPPPEITLVAPSVISIFPRFTHPDINALIWLLGPRYRNLIRQWKEKSCLSLPKTPLKTVLAGSISSSPVQPLSKKYFDQRTSWTGMAMNEFYRSVRKALIVSVLSRIIISLGTSGWLAWNLMRWIKKISLWKKILRSKN